MHIEDLALILHRWPASVPPADTTIAHYVEVAAQYGVPALIRLTQSMPCCISTGDHMCGRGATVGCVTPNINGTWTLMPICERCTGEIAVIEVSSH